MFEQEQQHAESLLNGFCSANQLPSPTWNWGFIPFNGHWGMATSFFQLAALEARAGAKINVGQRAAELAELCAAAIGTPPGFEKVEAVRGYLNFYFSTAAYARQVIEAVLAQGTAFGRTPVRGERVMVEFSQPNTHKAMHVGHLRSAILGDTLCRILDFAGYDVVRANYPGDMGLHVIKWLWYYQRFHAGEKPAQDITRWVGALYAEANKRLEQHPEEEAEVRALHQAWDRGDPAVVALWEETRAWSLQGFNQIYDLLDIRFDRYYFNSMAEKPGKEVVSELIEKKIAQDERPTGPVIVKLDELLGLKQEKFRVLVVLRSDGTALYATEDLALARMKFQDYPDLVKSIYVVDVRQSLHFLQVFKTLELAGDAWATRCQHIPYELVSLPGNVVMASREGTVVLLEDLIREATSRALRVVEEKNPDLSPEIKHQVASAVGVGAIKYPMLARENAKQVTFDWQSALDFNGQAAPYIQYAHVRANSILRKAGANPAALHWEGIDLDPAEIELIDLLSRYEKEVQRAAAEYKPLLVANFSYDLARSFTTFYNTCPVVTAPEPQRSNRLALTAAVRTVLASSLSLLGIQAPDFM